MLKVCPPPPLLSGVHVLDRVQEEAERLARSVSGTTGLNMHSWPQLGRRIEIMATRSVKRSELLERDR